MYEKIEHRYSDIVIIVPEIFLRGKERYLLIQRKKTT